MAITEDKRVEVERRMDLELSGHPRVRQACFDVRRDLITICSDNDTEFSFAPDAAPGLQNATPNQLGNIEITPFGTGLHWPDLDADLFVPALLEARLVSKKN